MPLRDMNREQMWLLPPTLDELLPLDHPARFVAEFVDALDRENWKELDVEIEGDPMGAPSYHPRALLSIWLYGFMTGIRSSRKLEAACRDQIPYLWLTGWQHPDHNTLWRFYQGHRKSMRKLFRRTVRTALAMDLVDLAVQAVDGTKVPANASSSRSYNAEGLAKLLERLDRSIAELEDQNEGDTDGAPVHLPEELANKKSLQDQVCRAMDELEEQEGRNSINLTDQDAQFMKMRHGFLPAYNAQAMVSPVKTGRETSGMLVTATELVDEGADNSSLIPMLERAEETTGVKTPLTLADAGYHSAAALQECADRGQRVAMPESPRGMALDHPYHKDRFTYDADSDTYRCPQGQVGSLVRGRFARKTDKRMYQAPKHICQACPVVGDCIPRGSPSRSLAISPYDAALRRHRPWMATDEARFGVQEEKATGGTCLRDHQGTAGVTEVPVAWPRQRRCRMDPAGPPSTCEVCGVSGVPGGRIYPCLKGQTVLAR